jgi:hypothetical protein
MLKGLFVKIYFQIPLLILLSFFSEIVNGKAPPRKTGGTKLHGNPDQKYLHSLSMTVPVLNMVLIPHLAVISHHQSTKLRPVF